MRSRSTVGEESREKTKEIGPIGIAHGFNVGVLADVDPGPDRDPLRQVLSRTRYARPDNGLRVRADVFAQARTDRRQRSIFFDTEQQFHRAQSRCREDHSPAGELSGFMSYP